MAAKRKSGDQVIEFVHHFQIARHRRLGRGYLNYPAFGRFCARHCKTNGIWNWQRRRQP